MDLQLGVEILQCYYLLIRLSLVHEYQSPSLVLSLAENLTSHIDGTMVMALYPTVQAKRLIPIVVLGYTR